jgi:hypothetical protein
MNNDPHAEPPMLDDEDQKRIRASMNQDYVELALGYLTLSAKCFRIAGLEDVADMVERAVLPLKAKIEQAFRDPAEKLCSMGASAAVYLMSR